MSEKIDVSRMADYFNALPRNTSPLGYQNLQIDILEIVGQSEVWLSSYGLNSWLLQWNERRDACLFDGQFSKVGKSTLLEDEKIYDLLHKLMNKHISRKP